MYTCSQKSVELNTVPFTGVEEKGEFKEEFLFYELNTDGFR